MCEAGDVTVPVFGVLETGRTVDDSGRFHPTVAIDASQYPEISDLARVHAVEGIGDIWTEAARTEDILLLGIRMTRPVDASFVLLFDLTTDRPVLEDAADSGVLVIAHTEPERAAVDQPLWLAVDIDRDALRRQLDS